jgi:hypothetical protein
MGTDCVSMNCYVVTSILIGNQYSMNEHHIYSCQLSTVRGAIRDGGWQGQSVRGTSPRRGLRPYPGGEKCLVRGWRGAGGMGSGGREGRGSCTAY